jgi:hypothetical protein
VNIEDLISRKIFVNTNVGAVVYRALVEKIGYYNVHTVFGGVLLQLENIIDGSVLRNIRIKLYEC